MRRSWPDAGGGGFRIGDTGAVELPRAPEELLRALVPWRKGPWRFGEVEVDAEWRSDLKWNRVAGAVDGSNAGRVADVGGGNGYYAFRALAAGVLV